MAPIHQHLADVFESLGLHGVVEFSLKITPDSISPLRYVIGVNSAGVTDTQLRSLVAYFNPSYEVAESFLAFSAESTTYLFGQDGDWNMGSRRIYVERWNRLATATGQRSCHVMDAWKWRSDRCQDWVTSRYSVMPWLDQSKACSQFIELAGASAPHSLFVEQLKTLLSEIAIDRSSRRCVQLWRTEDFASNGVNLHRQTFDLNVLDYAIPLVELNGMRLGLQACFPGVAAQLSSWLSDCRLDEFCISHLACGINREQRFYFTVYYC